MNQTYRAVDMIPKDVVISDWHYERLDPTAAYFALKGFRVVTCPWRKPDITVQQLQLMLTLRAGATAVMRDRYAGMLHTVWSSARAFMDQFYGRIPSANTRRGGDQVEAFKALYDAIGKL